MHDSQKFGKITFIRWRAFTAVVTTAATPTQEGPQGPQGPHIHPPSGH